MTMAKRNVKPKAYIEDLTATIRKEGKRTVAEKSWKYNTILEKVQWMGADRITATDIAKRCGRTHEEITFKVGDFTIELKANTKGENSGEKKTL